MGLMDRLTLKTAMKFGPIPVAAWSKAWVCGRSLVGTGGFEFLRGHGFLSLVSVVCCAGRSYHDGQITHPGESYRECKCVRFT